MLLSAPGTFFDMTWKTSLVFLQWKEAEIGIFCGFDFTLSC